MNLWRRLKILDSLQRKCQTLSCMELNERFCTQFSILLAFRIIFHTLKPPLSMKFNNPPFNRFFYTTYTTKRYFSVHWNIRFHDDMYITCMYIFLKKKPVLAFRFFLIACCRKKYFTFTNKLYKGLMWQMIFTNTAKIFVQRTNQFETKYFDKNRSAI